MSPSDKISDVLDAAADLIEPEDAWIKGTNARDGNGNRVSAQSSEAICFCMAGALIRTSEGAYPKKSVEAVLPGGPIGRDWLAAWNDAPERTQTEVVAKLREAAALSREQGK